MPSVGALNILRLLFALNSLSSASWGREFIYLLHMCMPNYLVMNAGLGAIYYRSRGLTVFQIGIVEATMPIMQTLVQVRITSVPIQLSICLRGDVH